MGPHSRQNDSNAAGSMSRKRRLLAGEILSLMHFSAGKPKAAGAKMF
jgi:hypothetical protein